MYGNKISQYLELNFCKLFCRWFWFGFYNCIPLFACLQIYVQTGFFSLCGLRCVCASYISTYSHDQADVLFNHLIPAQMQSEGTNQRSSCKNCLIVFPTECHPCKSECGLRALRFSVPRTQCPFWKVFIWEWYTHD